MRFPGMFRRIAGALGALLLFTFTILPAAAQGLPVSTLSITAHDGKVHEFRVEVAASAPTRATGLMNRTSLGQGRGMIFIFPKPKEVSMWMKDTLLPLDMIFIDASGKIINIAQNARPMDETIIPSGGLSAYVLELAGGEAKRLHLAAGDRVSGQALSYKAEN